MKKSRKKLITILTKLFLTIFLNLVVACSSTDQMKINCPPAKINLEWYLVDDDEGIYIPVRSFKNLQLYIQELKQCI